MGRQVRDAKLSTREARSRLKTQHQPYWREITPGLHIGYRKGRRGGIWIARQYIGSRKYRKWRLGVADDIVDANGEEILSFAQADARARKGAPQRVHGQLDTVADATAFYLSDQKARSKNPRATEYKLDANINRQLGRIRLQNLTVERIATWHAGLAINGIKRKQDESAADARRRRQASANRNLGVLKAALNFAEAQGKLAGPTPWRRVRPFKNVDPTDQPFLSQDEANRLLNACEPGFRELVRAALETGCRYGELCAMNIRDYDPGHKQVAVRHSKGGKRRFVPLTDSGDEFFSQLTVGRKGTQPLFLSDGGERWATSQQIRRMKAACSVAEIDPPVPFKALRTTYGSWLAQAGTPLQYIAVAMGHADTRMTEKHYAHLMPSHVADTVRKNFPQFAPEQGSNVKRIRAG